MDLILVFLEEWAAELGALAVIAGAIGWFFGLFRKKPKTDLSDDTIEKIAPRPAQDGPSLTIPEFIRLRRELKADLEQEFTESNAADKERLRARIAELENQIANPEAALKEAQDRIVDLEARLTREGNTLGVDKLNAARAALAAGDYSAADDLFAEIEARDAMAVQFAARAAFARGEIADAAAHYARAAGLDPALDTLCKAGKFAWLSGDYPAALRFGEQALEMTRAGEDQTELARALNDHAITLQATGRYDEAEVLHRQALGITKAALGEDHPAYATRLNNLRFYGPIRSGLQRRCR